MTSAHIPAATLRALLRSLSRVFAIFVSVLSSYVVFADTTNVYDPAGRLVQVITTGGTSVTYVYDAGGNLKLDADHLAQRS